MTTERVQRELAEELRGWRCGDCDHHTFDPDADEHMQLRQMTARVIGEWMRTGSLDKAAGPLAAQLAKLRAVEALHTELAAERPSDHPLIAALANRLRRALDGT